MLHEYNIIVTENKNWHDWMDDRFTAEDDCYHIRCESSNKDDCINFVKGALLHAMAHLYGNKVPDVVTVKFKVIEK